jgi:hypothetical protein
VDTPAEPVAGRGGEHFVFLGVIEILDIEPSLLFTERGRRHHALAIRLERPEVVLESGDQGDVAHRPAGRQSVQQVADHAAVDGNVLRLCGLSHPGGDEHVAGPDAVQGGA